MDRPAFRRHLRATEKVPIQPLRELADDDVITRRDYRTVPPKVDYEMTPLGLSLAQALKPLCARGDENRVRTGGVAEGSSVDRCLTWVDKNAGARGRPTA
ncbi:MULTISPECIES: winged helix-turn-helix transcriptional regulator [unclassified Burkholderia]|uniref:winged helix-turn-helix transcriptional regulator n=1 Tax=unclassified Burkholderia TaxID=2613784 RepID=UPI001D12942E|nr:MULTISPECIES: winged helix-turn-helix transcriptional regulator [unclassified Burkholderia]